MKKILLIILLFASPCMADEYYLGQWEWNSQKNMWQAPNLELSTGVIDLRSLPQQAKAEIVEGYAIFTYSEKINDPVLIYLGNGKDEEIDLNRLKDIEKTLQIKKIKSKKIKDVIYEILTEDGDPTGLNGFKPILPNHNLKLEINIGNEGKIKEVSLIPNVSNEWSLIVKTIQNDYKTLLKNSSFVSIGRWLDSLEDQYKVSYENFIPIDAEIKLASLPHHTTYTEDFNCADRTVETGCDLSWTKITNDLQIFSNTVAPNSTTTFSQLEYRADSDLSSANMYAQDQVANMPTPGSGNDYGIGVITRKDNTATKTDYEHYCVKKQSGSDNCQIVKNIAGTRSGLGNANTTFSNADVVKGISSGSTISTYQNGSLITSVTDSSISSGTRAGIYFDTGGDNPIGLFYELDNFEAGDVASASSNYVIIINTQ